MQKQVKEIISTVQDFHANLAVEYLSLRKDAYDQRATMLLNYLSSKEEKVAKYLAKYLHDSKSKVLEMWVKVVPCLPVDVFSYCYKQLELKPPLHADDILDIAIHYDDCLVKFFDLLVRKANYKDTEIYFNKLLINAKKEEMNLSRDVLWLSDI